MLGFDFGIRRIGVALGNTITRKARELTTITAEGDAKRWAAIAALVGEWQPQLLVVGIPVHADGAAHAMTGHARRFARALADRFDLPVEAADERYTTQLAQSALEAARVGPRGRERRDALAAQLILQGWFDERAADS